MIIIERIQEFITCIDTAKALNLIALTFAGLGRFRVVWCFAALPVFVVCASRARAGGWRESAGDGGHAHGVSPAGSQQAATAHRVAKDACLASRGLV